MSDYIMKADIVKAIPHWASGDGCMRVESLRAMLELMEPVSGKWILHDVFCNETIECSCCHRKFIVEDNQDTDEWKFCPVCGTEMSNR